MEKDVHSALSTYKQKETKQTAMDIFLKEKHLLMKNLRQVLQEELQKSFLL